MIGVGAVVAGVDASGDVAVVEEVGAAVGSTLVVLEDLDFDLAEDGVKVYFVDMRVCYRQV